MTCCKYFTFNFTYFRKMDYRPLLLQICIINLVLILSTDLLIHGTIAASPPNVINVHEGTTAHLPCEYHHPDPDPPPSVIEWLRQGQQLPIFIKIGKYSPHMDPSFGGRMKVLSGKADLTIKRVEASDEGWYECRVIFLNKDEKKQLGESQFPEDQAPFINGTWAKLVVTAPPVFKYAPPNTITAREGEVLLLRCRATGRPNPVITWHKDGWPIKNGQDGVRLGDGELAVTLEKFHKGKYTCRAQNVEGQVEHTTTVYIQGAPVITTPPQNTTVKEMQDAMFTCRADGYPTNIKYSWSYNGSPVETSEEIRGRYSALGDGTLIIYAVVAKDKGVVTCKASNGFGKAPIATSTLTVQFPARVENMPSLLYAGLGLGTELPCPAVAVPSVTTVTWRRNDQVMNIEQNERFTLGNNGSLVIEDIRQRDAAIYTCTPYNILGTMGESTDTRLIVRYPPYFTKSPKSTYEAEIGKNLVVPCEGSGDPPPYVSWIKMDSNGQKEEIQDMENRVSFENGNLTIHSVAKSDHGSWQCVLSNAVASVKTDVMVYVKYTTPHAVTNISVVTSKHSAQISWTPGYDGGYSQHFMIWYKRADMGDHSWQTQSVESFRKVATVSNLEADTIYQFALLPENVLGSGQFSKTVTAKTKEIPPPTPRAEPESVLPPSRMESHVKKDSGLLLLMWQPPLDTTEEDLLGYIIEFRMLLEAEEENLEEASKEEEESVNLPLAENLETPVKESENDKRSKRSLPLWNRIVYNRAKRDAPVIPPTESPIQNNTETPKSEERWSAWGTLAPVGANETMYIVPEDKLFRDQLYEFQVMAVSKSAYSIPSVPITVSTKDLDVYPVLMEPVAYASAAMNPAIVAGISAAVLFVILITVLTSLWCRHYKRRKSALDSTTFTFGNLAENNGFDSRSRTKSESPSHRSVESKSSSKFRDDKIGPLAKLKKKMLKADVEVGNHYSSTEELVGLGRKVSNKQASEETQTDKNGQSLIRRISRASDGKFHVSDQSNTPSSHSALNAEESRSLMPKQDPGIGISPSRSSDRSHSVEWDPRSPLLQHTHIETPVPENGSESLEIDCSHSDIEVRYVKDGRGKLRCQSTSMSSLAGPRQYNMQLRQAAPYNNPNLDSSYASTAEYQQSSAPFTRQSMVSPAPHMAPYGQYVHLRPENRSVHPEYRVSSPPRLSDYNPTPASPPKYRYHKHADQPGGHYHISPRDSYANPTERLVFDPRYTRIEPIYEVGPHPNNPPNRHSSFVIDTRRELPHHPHPHRAIQIYRTTGPQKDGVNYPKPLWHDQNNSRYHTLPHQPQIGQISHAGAPRHHSDVEGVEASLMRHNANAVPFMTQPGDIRGPPSTTNTNSLGRSRRKSHEKETDSPRRRVCSVDDLTRENALPANSIHVTERSGSVDLLSPRKGKSSNTLENSSLKKDRTRGGSDHGEESSDVTATSSSSNSDKLPRGVVTSRHADLREETKKAHKKAESTKVVITNATSPPPVRDDDSSAVSSLPPPPDTILHNHRTLEVTSSGYDSHNTSHASESPAPSCSSPNVISNRTSSCHDRASTASSSDRSRKDTSSVDEKYEWDSEFAMESEILEALRHFGTHKRTGSVSQALVDEIQKLGMDNIQDLGKEDLENLEKKISDHRDSLSPSVDTSDMYTKESMERRCAALKKEYQKYQLEQVSVNKKNTTSPEDSKPTIFSTAQTNA